MSQDKARKGPVVWNVPFAQNPNFIGREPQLSELYVALRSGAPGARLQALSGLGGVGKTQLALEFAYRNQDDYDVVWWIRAEEPATLAADFADLAQALRLPGRNETDQRLAIESVKRWLALNGRWLLVFDSARDPPQIGPYLVPAGRGHVIVTSRHASWRGVATQLPVSEMKRGESVALLRRRTGDRDERSADKLAEALGDLPLALAQAGAYIEEAGTTLASYLELFTKRQRELLRRSNLTPSTPMLAVKASEAVKFLAQQPLEPRSTPSVATTWDISFQDVQRQSEVAADLLTLAAFLAPDDIPRDDLASGAAHLPAALAAALGDPFAFNDAIAALRRYSLIDVHDGAFSVHRLVQAALRERLAPADRAAWAERALRLVHQLFPPDADEERASWGACGRWLPHARAVTSHAEGERVARDVTAKLLRKAATYLYARKAFADARELCERGLVIAEEVHGPEHPDVAAMLMNLGLVLKESNEPEKGRAHAARALAIDEQVSDSVTIARDATNLAGILNHLGDRLDDAKALAEYALELDRRALGPGHPSVARDATTLGAILRRLGDLPGALEHMKLALEIDQKHLSPGDPQLTTRLNNVGFLFEQMGDRASARKYLEQALAVGEAAYGPDDPDVATFHSNLASVLHQLGDLKSAREHYERALAIGEEHHGPEHYVVAIRLNNLSYVLRDLGDLRGAREKFQRAIAIGKKALGPNHRRVKKFEDNLAKVEREMRDKGWL